MKTTNMSHLTEQPNETPLKSREPKSLISTWTDLSWEAFAAWVDACCHSRLASRPDLDPRDASQDVLVIVLRRDFAKSFDPRLESFENHIQGLIEKVCVKHAG